MCVSTCMLYGDPSNFSIKEDVECMLHGSDHTVCSSICNNVATSDVSLLT